MSGRKAVFALWGRPGECGDALAKCLLGAGEDLAATGVRKAQLNVSDDAVAAAMHRITAFPTPVDAVVSTWLPPDAPGLERGVVEILDRHVEHVEGWIVEEESPVPQQEGPCGQRQPGLANVSFLRCPEEMSYLRWLQVWRNRHTPAVLENQGAVGYVRNRVVAAVTATAPTVSAVVEELFPIEALSDPHAYFGSGGDGAELWRRATVMLESTAAFGADRDVDVIPTSRYRVL